MATLLVSIIIEVRDLKDPVEALWVVAAFLEAVVAFSEAVWVFLEVSEVLEADGIIALDLLA